MAGVFRDVTIEWEGEEYTFSPSNRLLRSIEGQGINIARFLASFQTGEIPASHLAYILAAFLRAGGANVTEDDAYKALMTSDEDGIAKFAGPVVMAMLPQGPDEKKPAAPALTKSSARAKPKPRARKKA